MDLAARCDAIEECYEFMLAYAAQGVVDERHITLDRLETALVDGGAAGSCEAVEREFGPLKKRPKLARRGATVFIDHTLGRIGQHELVALFDRVAARGQIHLVVRISRRSTSHNVPSTAVRRPRERSGR